MGRSLAVDIRKLYLGCRGRLNVFGGHDGKNYTANSPAC